MRGSISNIKIRLWKWYFMFLLFYPKWLLTPKGHFMFVTWPVCLPSFAYARLLPLYPNLSPRHSWPFRENGLLPPTTPFGLVCGLRDGLALPELMSRPMVVDTQAKEIAPQMRILFLLTKLSFVRVDSNGIIAQTLNNTPSIRHRVTEMPFFNNGIMNTANFFFLTLFLVVSNHTLIS